MNWAQAKNSILTKPTVIILLLSAFVLQVLTSYTNIGYFHPDQHFQLLEFAMHSLGEANAVNQIWEHEEAIRPSLGVYLYVVFHKFMNALGITNHYTIHAILRTSFGVTQWLFANLFVFLLLDYKKHKSLLFGLFAMNFLWFFPFIRSLYSSEMLSSILFFSGALIYVKKPNSSFYFTLLSGFLMGLSFYMRFQIAFAILGLAVWAIFIYKENWQRVSGVFAGLLVAFLLGSISDFCFYDKIVFTPYEYFYANIIEGVASSFGTSPFYYYVIEWMAVLGLPILSLLLFVFWCLSLKKHKSHWSLLVFLFFLLGHSVVGHKEERFLFPMFLLIPIYVAWASDTIMDRWENWNIAARLSFYTLSGLGLFLNFVVVLFFCFEPYSQPLHFADRLEKHFDDSSESKNITVYCNQRTPVETPSKLQLLYYQKDFLETINFLTVESLDDIVLKQNETIYLVSNHKYLHRKANSELDECFRPILYSSKFLWKINEWAEKRELFSIDDLWVLYQCDR